VILLVDRNLNMKNSDLQKSLIFEKHGSLGLGTHKRNNNGHPINGIWAPQALIANAVVVCFMMKCLLTLIIDAYG